MKHLSRRHLFALMLMASAVAAVQSAYTERTMRRESRLQALSMLHSMHEEVLNPLSPKDYSRVARTMERINLQLPSNRQTFLCVMTPDSPNYAYQFPSTTVSRSVCQTAALGSDQMEFSMIESGNRSYQLTRLTTSSVKLLLGQNSSELYSEVFTSFVRVWLLSWLGGILVLWLAITEQNQRFKRILRRRSRTHGTEIPTVIGEAEPQPEPEPEEINSAKMIIQSIRDALKEKKVLVIANREPYVHEWINGKIHIKRPASGLVTALEPVLRECGGTWLAYGGGSADRETCNEHNELKVPPEDPRYTLKRVWINSEEYSGYYEGFANEGLWPLCHLAHERPAFRPDDWDDYISVNRRFCLETPDSALTQGHVILVQDYHFAILPRMLRKRAKRRTANGGTCASIGIFWHIPWPNPEVVGICPYVEEILKGMLGADVIGFHTQLHVSNFLKACEQYLEARVDWEEFTVTMENHTTRIQAFPIGINTSPVEPITQLEEKRLRKRFGLVAEKIGVAVDRIDYTKGLIERMRSVERALEKYPDLIGSFTLIQIGSPSRSGIPAYRDLQNQLKATVERINRRFRAPDATGWLGTPYEPIVLVMDHYEWSDIQKIYQLGDVCLVTSLHDGMNLVAKEYVWCQKPERGSLILSRFTGASRELTEAFTVNPYSTDEMADAIYTALNLTPDEKRERMTSMKFKVMHRTAFHWASDLIQSLADTSEVIAPSPAQVLLEFPRTNQESFARNHKGEKQNGKSQYSIIKEKK